MKIRTLSVILAALSLTVTGCSNDVGSAHDEKSRSVKIPTPEQPASYPKNSELISQLNRIILAEGIPEAPSLIDINRSLPDLLERQGYKNVSPMNGVGSILYRSDGQNYKLIMLNTEDCGDAFKLNPNTVDPKAKRKQNGVDCTAYGYWTVGVAEGY